MHVCHGQNIVYAVWSFISFWNPYNAYSNHHEYGLMTIFMYSWIDFQLSYFRL